MTNSTKNGAPEFDFRKMRFSYETKMARMRTELSHLERQLQNLPIEQEPTELLDKMEAEEKEVLSMMLSIVTHLPDDYLAEGVSPDDVNYRDIDSLVDSLCFGSMDRLAVDIAQARQAYVKKVFRAKDSSGDAREYSL